jgi:hypothetical protein
MAQVHGKAGAATYRKGDRLLHWALFPMLSMGFLTYVFFRLKGGPASLLQIVVGCVMFGLGCWCVRDVFNLEAAADRYYGGAGGEQDVGLALSRLPEEFHIFNGLDFDAGDVDHVVVGPTGVFVVETKNHAGTISLRDGRLCRNGVLLSHDFVRQAISEAMYVKGRLRPQVPCHVRPVVVFVRARVRVRATIEGVRVVPLTSLADVITERAACLSREEIRRYVKRLGETETSVTYSQDADRRVVPVRLAGVVVAGAAHPGFLQLAALGRTATQARERTQTHP